MMTDFEKIRDFEHLYLAHKAARLGKRGNREVIDFEVNLSENLVALSNALREGSYRMNGYYSFYVHDPKERKIHALHYADRVVQHCICDQFLGPYLEKRLIYDNAACRIGKGTHFALRRVCGFLEGYYLRYGTDGWFLKFDIRKFFDNIDHEVLKRKLRKGISDLKVLSLLDYIVDSYEVRPGKGLPLGNQTSQWFAIYYLDGLDRLIKEKLRIQYYSRYMDDGVLIHSDRAYIKECLCVMRDYLANELLLEFNEKTQIFPVRNGVLYLGWHLYLSETGKVIRKVKKQTKLRYTKRLRLMQASYATGLMSSEEIRQVLNSYNAHLSFGHTYQLRKKSMSRFVLRKDLPSSTSSVTLPPIKQS